MPTRHPRPLLSALVLLGALAIVVGPIAAVTGPAAADTPAPACPATNYPNLMEVASGTPQTAKVDAGFETPLAVQLVSTDGCPVTADEAGIAVTFTAPSFGASGTFSATGTATATVGTTGSGQATAPALTANDVAGSYTVVATSTYGTVDFTLTNTATGVATTITATGGNPQSASVDTTFAQPLVAQLMDANGNPVVGATVTFAISANNGAGATFAGGAPSAMAVTNGSGIATTPPLMATTTAGSYTATATTPGVSASATYALTNLAATPSAITPGVGASQATPAGTAFPIPLAVTVTDTDGNPVAGAVVTFRAPAAGPSGVFAWSGATATTTTDSKGIAVAPIFVANAQVGGYVVTASAGAVASPAAFALVNQPGGTNSAPIAGSATTPDGRGYWVATADGGVFTYGDARFYGSAGAVRLAAPVVGIAATRDGGGYWLVAADGGIFSFGDAPFHGSAGGVHLAAPVVGIAATPDGGGYWIAAADGGVFAYGNARFYGSAGGTRLSAPIVGIAATLDGGGYVLEAANGSVFAYGDARAHGSA